LRELGYQLIVFAEVFLMSSSKDEQRKWKEEREKLKRKIQELEEELEKQKSSSHAFKVPAKSK
jgi:hypothetical protein